MADIVALRVQAIAWTHFEPPAGTGWHTDAADGDALAEFAGRACYESWDRPNPATATNAGFVRHVLEVGHLSVFEHAAATLYVTGVSRSLSHELVRHRHLSFSQLSQRHVPAEGPAVVEPAIVAADPELHARFVAATEAATRASGELLAALEQRVAAAGGADAALRRKQARQAARSLLPAAAETRVVVTGNHRAWRHFIAMRGSEHADVEIRTLAIACLRELRRVAPQSFADFEIVPLADGSEVAASQFVGES